MPYPSFPADLSSQQDSSKFKTDIEDNSIKGELEGGYTHARPRTTKRPRRTFETGYTDVPEPVKDSIESFFDTVGTHSLFEYTHPTTKKVYLVRFEAPPTTNYKGMGGTHLYDLDAVRLKEA